jgi:hypothetical protein
MPELDQTHDDRAKRLAELIQEAQDRPGVREAMAVYGAWQMAESVVRLGRKVRPRPRVTAATDSTPTRA